MSPRPKRTASQRDLRQEIIQTAWAQIAQSGASALSLRAIARELKITAPAIYNYFPDRDALVTALIVAAFISFAECQEQAIAGIPARKHAERLYALGLAYRQWAVSHRERYHLIFGTPIAGYKAPEEITMPAAERSLAILVSVLQSAFTAGCLMASQSISMGAHVVSMLKQWQALRAPDTELEVLFLALTVWARVHGLVSLEVSNQFPPVITEPEQIYVRELKRIVKDIIQ